MGFYVPGTEETDLKKIIMSLQQAHEKTATNADDIATIQAQPLRSAGIHVCGVERITSNQTVTSGASVKVQFNSVVFDPASIWDAANFRIKPTVAGYYQVSGYLFVSSGTTLVYSIPELLKNGSRFGFGSYSAPYAGINCVGVLSKLVHMNGSTDYLELNANTSGTGTISVVAGPNNAEFSAALVRAD